MATESDDVVERARVYISEPGTWKLMGGDTHRLVNDLRNLLTASNRRIGELEGAASADEIRLRQASEAAGVGYFGCDTPEVMADTIGELRELLRVSRARVAELTKDAERLDWLTSKTVGYGSGWIARPSRTGRGYRLHESNEVDDSGPHKTPREAIDAALAADAMGDE